MLRKYLLQYSKYEEIFYILNRKTVLVCITGKVFNDVHTFIRIDDYSPALVC